LEKKRSMPNAAGDALQHGRCAQTFGALLVSRIEASSREQVRNMARAKQLLEQDKRQLGRDKIQR